MILAKFIYSYSKIITIWFPLRNCYLIFVFAFFSGIRLSSATTLLSPDIFISLDGAWLFSQPGQTQQINLFDELGNTYLAFPDTLNNNTLLVGLGVRLYQNEWMQSNLSLRYLPMTGMTVQGEVWQLNSPEFNNFNYDYTIQSDILLIENTMTWSRHRVQPGIILGVGNATNTTSAYHEVPTQNHSINLSEGFPGETSNQFTYEVGAVLDYTFPRMTLECAYRYIHAGSGHLGLSPTQDTTETLSTGPLQYHAVTLGVRIYYAL